MSEYNSLTQNCFTDKDRTVFGSTLLYIVHKIGKVLFNIGFIQLDKNNPCESQIRVKAPQTDLDWMMINRIADANPDFKKFLKNITLTYKRHSDKNIAKPEWDLPE